jgi:nonribosomal peptide synthetase protein VioO
VAVRAAHDPATVVGLLAVWAAGGTYCPVDPGFPEARRRAMREAVGWRTTLEAPVPTDPPGRPPRPVPVRPADPAYVLFTSGSTGAPKPVLTPHRAIGAAVAALRALFGLTPSDRVLQFASLNWDTCLEEILPTLSAGACLVFDDEAYTGSFHRFLRTVARQRITVLDLPTAYWHELVHHLVQEPAGLPDCLRLVVVGGEPVNPARLADWRRLDTGRIRLLNTYGCTETTLVTHAVDLHGPRADPTTPTAGPVPIGRALPHVREHLTADGELLVGGTGLALGYHGQPEATAARFRTLPDGRRYFHTGDRVDRLPGGLLVPRGRLDGEVKIRGVRVDPAEVEAHIAAHPAVRAVAVVPVATADHTTLTAYVVPAAATAGLDRDVVAFLRDRAPAHLVPNRVVLVPDLAHTASGKVDRAASHRRHGAHHQIQEATA